VEPRVFERASGVAVLPLRCGVVRMSLFESCEIILVLVVGGDLSCQDLIGYSSFLSRRFVVTEGCKASGNFGILSMVGSKEFSSSMDGDNSTSCDHSLGWSDQMVRWAKYL
jgi:hypothetical protein